VELTVLGASGSWPDEGTALSGYLIREQGFNLWMDAGSGTMANLQQHIEIGDVHAMFLTHEHADHMVDVYPLFYARHYGGLGADGLPLYIPRGFGSRLLGLLSIESAAAFADAFDVHEVDAEEEFDVGPLRVSTYEMAHLGLPAIGFRIESNGSALAYTGDTGPADAVTDLARDTDLFLCEATWQDDDDLHGFHLSARQAGEIAKAAAVGSLMLTHILPGRDREVSRAQAAEVFDGPVLVAVDGMRCEVSR
jgi:ribonuclease BN (tRNA processing enzyme)